jgi:hypothetical protein
MTDTTDRAISLNAALALVREHGGQFHPVHAALRGLPAVTVEPQPAPDVAALVEAAHLAVSTLRACEAFINGCELKPFTPTPDAENVAGNLDAALRGEVKP